MSSELAKAKTTEIVQAIAKETGVKAADVEKVLNRLGLNTAIENRLAKIGADSARIAVNPISI